MRVTTICLRLIGLDAEYVRIAEAVKPQHGVSLEVVQTLDGLSAQTHRRRDVVIARGMDADALCALPCSELILVTEGGFPESGTEALMDVWVNPGQREFACRLNALVVRLTRLANLEWNNLYFRTFLKTVPDCAWIKGSDGLHYAMSDSFLKMAGKTEAECMEKSHAFIWGLTEEEFENSPIACKESDAIVLNTGKLGVFEETVAVGSEISRFATYKNAVRDTDGAILGTCGVARDVTDFWRVQAELSHLLANIPLGALILDRQNRVRLANPFAEQMFRNVGGAELEHMRCLPNGDFEGKFSELIRRDFPDISLNDAMSREAGETFVRYVIRDILDAKGEITGQIALLRDMTTEHRASHSLWLSSHVDQLTNVFNRRYFYESAKPSKVGGVILADLDQFKQLNDRYGHKAGDRCLQKVAALLKSIVPGVARLGGDEFAAYLPDTPKEEIFRLATEINRQFEASPELREMDVHISIGVSVIGQEGKSGLDDLMHMADAAMYANKRQKAALRKMNRDIMQRIAATVAGSDIRDLVAQRDAQRMKTSPWTLYEPGMRGDEKHSLCRVR